jgi:hypothetical protein
MTIYWCTECQEVWAPYAGDDLHKKHKEKIVGFDRDAYLGAIRRFVFELRKTGRLKPGPKWD